MRVASTLFALTLGLTSGLMAPVFPGESKAYAQASCAVWSTYDERDGKATNLTATACASTEDDSSAIGLQCTSKKPQMRYYPGNGAQNHLPNDSRLAITFTVGDQSVPKTMRYDGGYGVFSVNIGKTDPLLQMLQSGGPLDISSDSLGAHRFRLLGSTAAIAAVMDKCGVKKYIGPPPPAPITDGVQ